MNDYQISYPEYDSPHRDSGTVLATPPGPGSRGELAKNQLPPFFWQQTPSGVFAGQKSLAGDDRNSAYALLAA